MSGLLLWIGLTLILAFPKVFGGVGIFELFGSVLMIIGAVIMLIEFIQGRMAQRNA